MSTETRKISAKALIADIRAGLDDPAVMARYSLSETQLESAFRQLLELGVIDKSELDGRVGVTLTSYKPDERTEAEQEPGAESGFIRRKWTSVLHALQNTDRPIRSYVWRAWLISVIPTLFIGIIAVVVVAFLDYTPPSPNLSIDAYIIVGLFLAPFLESCLMLPILWILKLVLRNTLWVALASALIWGCLHALSNVVQGVVIVWAFFVMSQCFLAWEKKSKLTGIGVTALVHMCHNFVPVCVFVLLSLFGGETPGKKAVHTHPASAAKIEKVANKATPTIGPLVSSFIAAGGDKETVLKFGKLSAW
jgi:membrane protease YdiL (CAAX protease family)